jgi:hypothetical protein
MEAPGLVFLALYEKVPSLVGVDVVTDRKINYTAQGSSTIKPMKLEAFKDGYMSIWKGQCLLL